MRELSSFRILRLNRSMLLWWAVAAIAVACGSTAESTTPTEADSTEEAVTASAASSAVATTTTYQSDYPFDELFDTFRVADLDPPDVESELFTASVLGGVRFDYPAGWTPSVVGERVFVSRYDGTVEQASAEIMLVSHTMGGAQVSTLEDFLGALSASVVPHRPADDKLSLLGYELDGFDLQAGDLAKPYAYNRAPATSNGAHGFGFGEFNRSFFTSTPAGLLWVNVWGTDAETLNEAGQTLQLVAQSAEFTGPGLDSTLPPGRDTVASTKGRPPTPATGGTPETLDGAEPLLNPFFDPPAGTYSLPNTGRHLIVDIDENTKVQPNFPGLVVLTDVANIVPGPDVLAFRNNVTEVVPAVAGPVFDDADLVSVSSVDDVLENLPSGVQVTNVERDLAIAGLDAVSFEMSANPDADCTEADPCTMRFLTPYAGIEVFEGMRNKIWWIEDYLDGENLVIHASSPYPDTDWFDRADAMVESMRFAE